MRKPMVAANWKMNGGRELIAKFAAAQWPEGQAEVVIAVPSLWLDAGKQAGLPGLSAQDVSAHDNGAHTGEISAQMLKEMGCAYAIIGHSERREAFGEDEALLIEKWKQLKAQGVGVIYCIGESLAEYEAGEREAAIRRQIQPIAEAGLLDEASVIAYEPIWAIGTGKAATPEYAQSAHQDIRKIINKNCGTLAARIRVLYGGSVKPDNAKQLAEQEDIDGFLVGGASLDVQSFVKIVEAFLC
ncbi:MAG: triose-phosphate isomerase [Cardiobacteriaceae bacterium]|nr:triose-phosphate isomerase [Cardiobacteriaceae bacterium]